MNERQRGNQPLWGVSEANDGGGYKMVIKMARMGLIIIGFIFLLLCSVDASEVSGGLVYPEYSKLISMDFQNANLKDVLKILSQQSGLNFVSSELVKDRKITVYLNNVPVEKALQKLLVANNLVYEIDPESDVFIVRESSESDFKTLTKVHFLKYASVSNSKLSNEINTGTVYDPQNPKSATIPPGTIATNPNPSGIVDIIRGILTSKGSVREDPRTNSLTITDVPSQFGIIDQTISQLDIPLPQVMIEVEMLDVTKDTVDRMGLVMKSSFSESNLSPFKTKVAPKAGEDAGSYTLGTLNFSTTAEALQFLSMEPETKYLARPRLLTLSNETAEIKIATQEAVGLTTAINTAGGVAIPTSGAERAETGVSLRVTPQVNTDTSEITMYIEPRVGQTKKGGTFGTATFKDPEEILTKSVVRVRDGETIVVGGLLRNDAGQVGNVEREFIVFISPHIVKEPLSGDVALKQQKIILSREQEGSIYKNSVVDKVLQAVEKRR